jgi:hypothetical protein
MYCTYCGSALHPLRFCPHTYAGQTNRVHLRCSYCGQRDHEREACPKTWAGSSVRAQYPETVEEHFIKDKEEEGRP